LGAQPLLQGPSPRAEGGWADIPDDARVVTDEIIAELALSQLHLLARHAVDNGGAWGEATVAEVLTDGGREHLKAPIVLCHTRFHGLLQSLGSRVVDGRSVRSTLTVDVTATASEPREAIVGARLLGSGLVNAFGWPELSQFTAEGKVRRRYLSGYHLQLLTAWAVNHGVELADEADST
jgi:hypothetical protein